ncbi:MAG: L-rhamnose mutarotase [Rhizomicrobium sp.]
MPDTNDLETVAFRMVLHPGHRDEYKRRHDEIWPELKSALQEAGVVDYRIFLDEGSNHLFAVMTRHKNNTLAALRDCPVNRRWWAMMADIMQTEPDQAPCEWPLTPVFHLSAK